MRILLALAAFVAATPNVTKLILKPTQVGKGYVLLERRDGVGVVNTVTLDLCGRTGYPSEKLRTTRLQVNYLKRGTTLGLSNEVVTYKTGGAARAMREVLQHTVHCPKGLVSTGTAGLPPFHFTVTRIHDAKLLRGSIAVRVRVRGKLKGKPVDETSYAIYQRVGDVLSGTYSFGPNSPTQQQFALHAAEQSAKNLLAGGPPSGPTA
jgi:hypothetical protein